MWSTGQIWPTSFFFFFVNEVLLENRHYTHSSVSMTCFCVTMAQLSDGNRDYRAYKTKCLLSYPIQEKLANPEAITPDIRPLCTCFALFFFFRSSTIEVLSLLSHQVFSLALPIFSYISLSCIFHCILSQMDLQWLK